MQIKTKSGRMIYIPTPEEDAAITAAAETDPDAQPLTEAEWAGVRQRRGRPPASITKTRVTIRLDADVVAIYKADAAKQGKNYQTSINEVLRKHANDLRLIHK